MPAERKVDQGCSCLRGRGVASEGSTMERGTWELVDFHGASSLRVAARAWRDGEALVVEHCVSPASALILRDAPGAPEERSRGEPGRHPLWRDELWRVTCFEAFVARPGSPGYMELNASPRGHFALYSFDSVRAGMRPLADAEVVVRSHEEGGALVVRTRAAPRGLSGPLRVGLTAVVEVRELGLRYFALSHAGPKPDFHRPETWSVELA
jgi:hypothetical protein